MIYLNKFNKLNSRKKCTKDTKTNAYDKTSDLYNDLLAIHFMNVMNYEMLKEKSK